MIQLLLLLGAGPVAWMLEHTGYALKRQYETRWMQLSPHRRAAIRWVAIISSTLIIFGLIKARLVTEIILVVAGIILLVWIERKLQNKVRNRHLARATVNPLAQAVAAQFGVLPEVAQRSISIRPDYAKAHGMEHVGTIVLPQDYAANPGQRELLEHLARSRLGMDLEFRWRTQKHPMTLEIQRAPVPPTLVPLSDMLPVIRGLPADKVLLGLTGKGEQKFWDMGSEDPHCLVSANTRRGKTRLLLLIASQALYQRADKVTVIDPKRVGADEALAGIPGVDVHSDPRDVLDMWQAIHGFREFMDARIDQYMEDRTIEFKRALLIIDELSQFAAMSKVYWDNIRDKGTKAVPPIWNDVAAILWQGAQFKCSMLVFGQRIEHNTLAGLIDSFGTRLLAGYTKQTYMRLVGINPVPVSQRPRGRFLFFDGEQPQWIQTVLGTDQELRSLALEGKPLAKPTLEQIIRVTESREKS